MGHRQAPKDTSLSVLHFATEFTTHFFLIKYMVCDFNPITGKAEAGGSLCEYGVSLVYTLSFRTVRTTQRDPVSENKQTDNNKAKRTIEGNQKIVAFVLRSLFRGLQENPFCKSSSAQFLCWKREC